MRRTNEIQGTEEEVTGLTDQTVKDTAVWGIHGVGGGGSFSSEIVSEEHTKRRQTARMNPAHSAQTHKQVDRQGRESNFRSLRLERKHLSLRHRRMGYEHLEVSHKYCSAYLHVRAEINSLLTICNGQNRYCIAQSYITLYIKLINS